MNDSLISSSTGGYRFLPGIEPYSSGVIAEADHQIIHVTPEQPVVWNSGLTKAKAFLQDRNLPIQALCGVELRCPEPHSLHGFSEFNAEYRRVLENWECLLTDKTPSPGQTSLRS